MKTVMKILTDHLVLKSVVGTLPWKETHLKEERCRAGRMPLGTRSVAGMGLLKEKKNAALKKEEKKLPQARGDPRMVPVPAWTHFMAACRHRFASWPPEGGIKTPLDVDKGGLNVSPPEGPEQPGAVCSSS